MAKISMELLQRDYNSYLKLKNSIDKANGKMNHFGKNMNIKYNFNDDILANELNHNIALLIIMKNHLEETTK
tara:strand:+ start:1361 stop:1576 length:216 start_codon:yes stop_codon:yes gene_type:complete